MPQLANETKPIQIAGNGAVLAERHEHTLLITLNRPEVRNAVNLDLSIGVGEALEYAQTTAEVWTVIITGAGTKAFCAGADLKAVAAGEMSSDDERLARWGFAGFVKHAISKPTIAAVNGFALGGGTELALASDLVVAVEEASFGLPEVTRGIFAGAGGAFRLPQQIPVKIAMEMLLTARPISAERALALGLVNAVVPHDQLLTKAFELADAINENAPLAVQVTKRIARGIDGSTIAADEADWSRTDREGTSLMASADAMEGLRAFAERRAPRWRGH